MRLLYPEFLFFRSGAYSSSKLLFFLCHHTTGGDDDDNISSRFFDQPDREKREGFTLTTNFSYVATDVNQPQPPVQKEK